MKKVLIASIVLMTFFSATSFAQDKKKEGGEFKPFKVDVSLGYAIPMGGTGSKGGVLFAVEPKYAVMDALSLGLRIETAVTIAGVNLNTGTVNSNASAKAAASFLATGDYYLSNQDFRPFLGAGAGLFTTAGVQVSNTNSNVASGTTFGGMVRAGFEWKHARFGVEYNIVSNSTVAPSTPNANDGYTVQNSYLGIKLGVCIGGGRIK